RTGPVDRRPRCPGHMPPAPGAARCCGSGTVSGAGPPSPPPGGGAGRPGVPHPPPPPARAPTPPSPGTPPGAGGAGRRGEGDPGERGRGVVGVGLVPPARARGAAVFWGAHPPDGGGGGGVGADVDAVIPLPNIPAPKIPPPAVTFNANMAMNFNVFR